MIYKDAKAPFDDESLPACRPFEDCLNCGMEWSYHLGWSCSTLGLRLQFSKSLPNERYETKSMRDSLGTKPAMLIPSSDEGMVVKGELPIPSDESKKDLSDWRAWAHNRPGECPCGIVKSQCDYHR